MSGSLEQSGNLKPTYGRDQEAIWREIRKLWAGVNNRTRGVVRDVPFTLGGPIYASTSPRYYCRTPSVLQRALVSLDVPGGGTTSVRLYKNTDVITTIDLGSGVDKTQVALNVNFEPDTDYLRVGVITAAPGAAGLGVQCRFLVLE